MSALMVSLAALATLGSALMAGAFFAFSSFIMTALGRLPPAHGISAMQEINVVVINRSFLGTFAGTAAVSLVVAVLAIGHWSDPRAPWFLGGALCYFLGTFGVTGAGNVPLNDRLAAVSATDPSAAELWSHYRARWTTLNTVRTVAAVAAGVLFGAGFVQGAGA